MGGIHEYKRGVTMKIYDCKICLTCRYYCRCSDFSVRSECRKSHNYVDRHKYEWCGEWESADQNRRNLSLCPKASKDFDPRLATLIDTLTREDGSSLHRGQTRWNGGPLTGNAIYNPSGTADHISNPPNQIAGVNVK